MKRGGPLLQQQRGEYCSKWVQNSLAIEYRYLYKTDLNIISKIEMYCEQKKHSFVSPTQQQTSCEQRKMRGRKEKCLSPSIFIMKTHQILENAFYNDVVSWNKEGSHFIIHNIDRFEQEVLPLYFRHRKFSSFVRQLNMYDFHKIRNEGTKNIFEHKDFRRDTIQTLRNIKRKGCLTQRRCETSQINDQHQEIFQSDGEFNFEQFQDQHKNTDERLTFQSINQYSVAAIFQTPMRISTPENEKKQKAMNEFVQNLPQGIKCQEDIKDIIEQLKKKNLSWLDGQKEVHKLIKKIKRNKMTQRKQQEGLQDLSIQEQIMAENIDREAKRKQPQLESFNSEIWRSRSANNLSPPAPLGSGLFLQEQSLMI